MSDPETPGPGGTLGDPTLPLLPVGHHLGIWPTYETLPIGTAAALEARLDEAHRAGMLIKRVHLSWADLERAAGELDLAELEDRLAAATADGSRVHVLIETIDSEGFVVPADLAGDAPYELASGRRFDDPEIIARFAALLDAAVPMFGDRVFALSVGNEPDNRFDDLDAAGAETWSGEVARFTAAARARVQAIAPEIAVAMTLTQRAPEVGRDLTAMIAAGDVAVFNYYCQDPDFIVQRDGVVAAELDQLVALAGTRAIVIQELGCPAGVADSRIGASEPLQAAFFSTVARELAARPTMRAAFVFQAIDWSPELVSTVEDSLAMEGLPDLAARYGETLGTIGVLRFRDARPRPAWQAILDAIGDLQLASGRP